ncbi:HIT-like protein [Glarea lozoyensis ATCC 20868]|uniref:HIT-like protein n=1 Tax=Glarea lozoyensis (strain ATCC 20868 / MF5171) TaxID=1116229 RepID=S3E9V5_GLAL2|nr:HIT-like protein [Glarea lozoyensis ATCC 20868]EPE35113.1 HIT-like protein [Glarea lozoyensis ATCC 20868]
MSTLPNLVRSQFKAAQGAGDLTFYSTQVAILICNGFTFQLRFSPSLANKPKSAKKSTSKPFDPFETPQRGLFVTNIGLSHYLVLNKFPVIPDHFILATTKFKEQTDLLEEDDIEATYKCIKGYREAGEELFGFFNSGEHSGASQRHRHIQFLPVQSMRSGIEESSEWTVLADTLLQKTGLPFQYFASPVSPSPSSSQLHSLYTSMYHQARELMTTLPVRSGDTHASSPENNESSTISYNMAFTENAMILCPRLSEGPQIASATGELIGPIALNGTILGGTLLVKTEEEWQSLRDNPLRLKDVLGAIGFPSRESEKNQRL